MNKQLFGILSLIGLLFIFLFIMLSYYSRLATDDYYFIGDIKNHGMFEQVYFQYMNWSGRYAATMAINIFYNLFGLQQHYYLILPVFSLLFLVLGTSLVVYQVFLYLKIHIRFIYALLIGLLFSSCLFFLSFEIGESWFWYCGYSSYLWSITAFIWGIYFLLLNKNIVISTILASLCFIYVGGASEIYSAIIGLCYTIYLYKSYRNKNSFWWINKFVRNKVIIAYCFFALSFLLFLVAPGNYLRDELFPEHHIPEAVFICFKSFVKLFVFYLPSKILFIVCFSSLFYLIGFNYSNKINTNSFFKQLFRYSTFWLMSLLIVFYMLVSYVMVETGPARVLFFVSFLISVYIAVVSFSAGLLSVFSKQIKLIWMSSIGFIFALFFLICTQYLITSRYAQSNDERVEYLKTLKSTMNNDTLLLLKPLAPSGMLYSAEITSDTTHFTNREVKMGFDLKFNVVVEKP